MNVSKQIDKELGAERKIVGTAQGAASNNTFSRNEYAPTYDVTEAATPEAATPEAATPEAAKWEGWGTALKPAFEPIVVARKPLIGTVAANVLKYGTGALNIDGCRVGLADWGSRPSRTPNEIYGNGNGTNLTTSSAPEGQGRWPANLVLVHAPDCKRVGERTEPGYAINRFTDGAKPFGGGAGHEYETSTTDGSQVPVYECVDGCPVKELDRQSGILHSQDPVTRGVHRPNRSPFSTGDAENVQSPSGWYADQGGASRFFNTFEPDFGVPLIYCAKAATAEREAGLKATTGQRANIHPTTKPVELMRHLVRLVTPPGGTVLDPFMGSGTTGIAAIMEGFNFIGIEKDTENGYMEIATARIKHAESRKARSFTTYAEDDEQGPDLFSI